MAHGMKLVVLAALACFADARLREGDCEVCLQVIEKFTVAGKGLKSEEKLENMIRKQCKGFTDEKEKRMCYYIGGTNDAATTMLRQITGPLKNALPIDRICEKLKKRDYQICELKYEKAMDIEGMDIKKQRVKVLKKILTQWGENCKGCTSKSDYVKRVEDLMPKHAPKKDL